MLETRQLFLERHTCQVNARLMKWIDDSVGDRHLTTKYTEVLKLTSEFELLTKGNYKGAPSSGAGETNTLVGIISKEHPDLGLQARKTQHRTPYSCELEATFSCS